jgi:hypothetical protein
LAREAWEESQVTVSGVAYLGFEQARGWGRESFALVRVVGRIGRFAPRRPDSDGGRLLARWMLPLKEAPVVLGWGAAGQAQAEAAAELAAGLWGLPVRCPAAAAGYVD